MKITVFVKTNAKKELILKNEDGSFTVKVRSLPVDGEANKRVIELLSKYFEVPKSQITIDSGLKSKIKTISF